MRVFISWSGTTSQQVAIALRNWLPSVLQVIDPYVSSADIDKGARWLTDIGQNLEKTGFGILCVTRENMDSPWLNFEAGALAKSFDSGKVTPFLTDMPAGDLTGPISQFQATLANESDVADLIRAINKASEAPIADDRLAEAIGVWWPRLQGSLANISSSNGAGSHEKPVRPVGDMVEELLVLTRSIQRGLKGGSAGSNYVANIKALNSALFAALNLAGAHESVISTGDDHDLITIRTTSTLTPPQVVEIMNIASAHGKNVEVKVVNREEYLEMTT